MQRYLQTIAKAGLTVEVIALVMRFTPIQCPPPLRLAPTSSPATRLGLHQLTKNCSHGNMRPALHELMGLVSGILEEFAILPEVRVPEFGITLRIAVAGAKSPN
jgi:hypothetical protein